MLNKLNKEDLLKKWEKQQPPAADQRPAKVTEQENSITVSLAKSFTDEEIELLFPAKCLSKVSWWKEKGNKSSMVYNKVRHACVKLRLHPIKSYTVIRDREAYTFQSTASYPIFMIDEGDFKLIYQPLHADPEAIYQYYGQRPNFYLHGFAQAAELYQERLDNQESPETPKRGRKKKGEQPAEAQAPKPKKIVKLDEIIMVPEPADAFGLALLGYLPVYHGGKDNSLEKWDFIKMMQICNTVYQVRNNTEAGHEQAHEVALKHLELVTIELPELFEQILFDNGVKQIIPKPILNVRDYFTWHNDHDFEELLKDSMPYQFWDKTYDGTGYKYEFSHVRVYNFLNKMGFFRLPVEGEKADYLYIRKDGNIVRKTRANDVKNFINRFLKDRRLDHDLRDYIHRVGQLSEGSLSNLEETQIDFTDYDGKRQFLFFGNATYEVTAAKIVMHPAGKIERFVWDADVIEHEISEAPVPFRIIQQPDKSYDIEVLHHDCLFFNYLIQTSRMHWRTELETGDKWKDLSKEAQADYRQKNKFNIAGELLTDEERYEQKQHLLNKMYALGYLLHRYKDRSQSWAVVAVDNNTPADGKSYGGTGKSICFNQGVVAMVKNNHKIPGTNPKITDNPHIFHGLNKHHRVLIIDDADKALNFRFFFEFVTGDQVVNPKNNAPFTIPFKDLAKLIWLTNFSFITDPSTMRRILFTAFSDYYHAKSDNYESAYEPKDDFEKELFTDFNDAEWNQFYNTMAYCLQFYLQCPAKLEAPMNNVEKRNLQREMGEILENWAGLYFHPDSENTDRIIIKEDAWLDFKNELPKSSSYSVSRFKTGIKAFCKYHGYEFNPEELINDAKENRIIYQVSTKKMSNSGFSEVIGKKAKECIYIRTNFEGELNKTPPEEIMKF